MNDAAWLIAGCVAAIGIGWLWIAAKRAYERVAALLLARRPNPSREEFIAMLAGDVSAETAGWFWQTLQVYYQPLLTPHPDDDLMRDLRIDPDEPDDWVRDFCRLHGLKERELGLWPDGLAVTPRNLLHWLECERSKLAQRCRV